MHLGAAQQHLLPIASVLAGVFLLVAPRIVSIAVAVYLIDPDICATHPLRDQSG